MAATSLPYLVSPGSLKTALEKIRSAAKPERISGDFINTKLQIKGGTGRALVPYLKKIGFVATDGSPTDIYTQFRNTTTGAAAAAKAVKLGYAPLAEVNENFYGLQDKDLLNLIVQVTGLEKDSSVAKLTLSTLKNLKSFANFEASSTEENPHSANPVSTHVNLPKFDDPAPQKSEGVGLNLSYTINLNLPATTDQAVFNAIFRSLKEHLINEQ